jgi:hypothetical protein
LCLRCRAGSLNLNLYGTGRLGCLPGLLSRRGADLDSEKDEANGGDPREKSFCH